jgi:hypothetical protein
MQINEPKRQQRKRLKPTVLVVIVLAFALGCTAVATPAIYNLTERFPPFYTEDGEFIDPVKSYEYALEQKALKGDNQLFYTREQLKQLFDNGVTAQIADIRQPHIQPIPIMNIFDGEIIEYIDGIPMTGGNAPYDLCDNTFYFLHEGKRACNQCGYIFTEEQDRAIGLID